MASGIIKEQRLIRTLFYSLIESSNIFAKEKDKAELFTRRIEHYIKARVELEDETRQVKEIVNEIFADFGWKNVSITFNRLTGSGKLILGKNRFLSKENDDQPGTLLFIKALVKEWFIISLSHQLMLRLVFH